MISLRLCHLVMLATGNYHWFPSYFVTWSCWLYPETERRVSFVVCFSYIHRLKEECVLLFVLVISTAWKKSVFCCLIWLYPEPQRRVYFVVCFGYIQRLKEEWVLLFLLVISRDWKKSEFCCLFWLYPKPEESGRFVVRFGYIQSLEKRGNILHAVVFGIIQYLDGCHLKKYNSL